MPQQMNCSSVPIRDSRIRYAISVLLNEPEIGDWPSWLAYSREAPNPNFHGVHIVASDFFDRVYGTVDSMPRLPLSDVDGVPLLFGKPHIQRVGDCLIVHADIVASAYFLLTRYEEWIRPEVRDIHGRFLGTNSLSYRAGFLDRPIVDEYAELLRRWASRVGIDLPKPDRHFSVLLTHDVDTLGPGLGPIGFIRSIASGLLGRRPLHDALRNAVAAMGLASHPADNLPEVIQLDRQLTDRFSPDCCRSVFFFLAGDTSLFDGSYRLGSERAARAIRQVSDAGACIGLHASCQAGINPARIAVERKTLQAAAGIPIEANRHHYLAWREPNHGIMIAEAGIRWDSSLGYADVAGFRLGVCRPVPLFDPIERRLLGIEEHPLTVMDCTLDRPNYMNLDEDAAFDYVRNIADATFDHQGELVFLWHNDVLASTATGYHRYLYPRILHYVGQLLERDRTRLENVRKV